MKCWLGIVISAFQYFTFHISNFNFYGFVCHELPVHLINLLQTCTLYFYERNYSPSPQIARINSSFGGQRQRWSRTNITSKYQMLSLKPSNPKWEMSFGRIESPIWLDRSDIGQLTETIAAEEFRYKERASHLLAHKLRGVSGKLRQRRLYKKTSRRKMKVKRMKQLWPEARGMFFSASSEMKLNRLGFLCAFEPHWEKTLSLNRLHCLS